jgi:plasmid stabilization system protein ParE
MRIQFSRRAADDLRALIEWYQEVAPQSLERVLGDINRSFDLLIDFPQAGQEAPSGKFRHIATRRYRYRIAYRIAADHARIVGIYRFQNRER